MYHIVKSIPNPDGGHYLGIYKGPAVDAAAEFHEGSTIIDVTVAAEAAIATLQAHPNEAMYDLAKTISNPKEGFLDLYEMAAIFMQHQLPAYIDFAKTSQAYDPADDDLEFRDFVAEYGIRGRYVSDADRFRIEWIARTIVGRQGAPAAMETWFPEGEAEAA